MVVEPLTPDRRREMTRDALVEAATSAFARLGFDGASVDAIAEAAGFTKGAVYSNFGSKEELFFAVIERRVVDQMERFAADLEGERGGRDDLLEAASDVLAMTSSRDRDWIMLEVEVWLYAQRHPEARRRLAAAQRQTIDRLAGFIEDVIATTGLALRRPAREVATLVTAANSGIAQLHLADPDGGHEALFGWFLQLVAEAVLDSA